MYQPASEFREAWSRFKAGAVLRLVPDTLEAEWAHGRSRYLAFLIPIDDPAVRDYIASIVKQIARIPGIEAYPASYWHVTIKAVGFEVDSPAREDEVSPAQAHDIAERAAALLEAQPPFAAQAGVPNAFPEVVFLELYGRNRVRELNNLLIQRIPGMPRYPIDGDVFLPHISIARFSSAEGLDELKAVIEGLRRRPPGPTFTARHIDLIRAHLSETIPTFEHIRRYGLRG
jgi:2'-5' RNA ligase